MHRTKIVRSDRVASSPIALRALAGGPMGLSDFRVASRRGSTLILVVGALAFLAVLIAAYLSLGQRDRRASASSVEIDKNESNTLLIRDHIAGVIADDVASVYSTGDFNFTRNGAVIREGFDFPYTSPFKYSDPSMAPTPASVGTAQWVQARFTPSGSLPREWAANMPILAFEASDPFLASSEPVWLFPDLTAPVEQHLDNAMDLLSISNIAPDGRVVNLFNLRNNYDSKSGVSTSSPATNQTGRLSDNIWQFDLNGAVTKNWYDGAPADPNVPAHWTTRQLRMHRPAVSSLFGLSNYHDSRYSPYMYADADGDGFFDSRYQELVDGSDPMNVRSLLPADSRLRWFVATKIVDLSGRVNVNTAGDFWQAPTDADRMGATPADIDLMRLLTLNDSAVRFQGVGTGEFSYNRLYMGAVPTKGNLYTAYTGTFASGQAAFGSGANAFAAIQQTIDSVLPVDQATFVPFSPLTAQARSNWYNSVGVIGPGRPDSRSGNSQYTFSGAFDTTDLLELLRFNGVNDNSLLSRLEQAASGRSGNAANEQHSPLRSSRSAEVERGSVLNPNIGYDPATGLRRPASVAGSPVFLEATDVRRHLTTISGGRALRTETLPISLGTTPQDQQYNIGLLSQVGFAADESRANVLPWLNTLSAVTATNKQEALDSLFGVYARALVPASDDINAWDSASQPALQSRSYGSDSLLALRMAAHMTLNLADSFDEEHPTPGSENEVRASTLLIDQGQRALVDSNVTAYPWWTASEETRLDLGDGFLPDSSSIAVTIPPAINVFGMEAYPVLTQVAVFNVYTDTPKSAGGDEDWETVPPGTGNEPVPQPITIDGRIPSTGGSDPTPNPDFLMQVVAFQINNPFDHDVRIADDTGAYFYVEFGGKRYELIETGSAAGVDLRLNARETRVFYAMSQGETEINARFNNAQAGSGTNFVSNFVSHQLTVHQFDGDRPAIRVLARDVSTGTAQTLATVTDLLAGDPSMNVPTEYAKNRVVHLWRKMFVGSETHLSNSTANDLLVDRLRDPADPASNRPTLDQRLPSTNNDVVGTEGFDEGSSNPGDNTGFSIVMWGSIRRPDTPLKAAAATREPEPIGAIPAWCVERPGDVSATNTSFNDGEEDSATRANLKKSDFAVSGSPSFSTTGWDTLASLVTATAGAGTTTLVGSLVSDVFFVTTPTNPQYKFKTGNELPSSMIGTPVSYADKYPQLYLDNEEFERTGGDNVLRPFDILLPMVIGPWQNPAVASTATDRDDWTTFGEMLAMASGYDTSTEGQELFFASTRGQMWFDQFIEHEDTVTVNGLVDPNEPVFGPGTTFAMRLVDSVAFDDVFAGSTKPVLGQVNINTATRSVLSVLPGLSPSTLTGGWWWAGQGKHEPTSDIAATVASYRDLSLVMARDQTSLIDFRNGRADSANSYSPTAIQGIRETPGFASPSEVVAARAVGFDNHSIDKLGFDTLSTNQEGVSTVRYEDPMTGVAYAADDGIKDDIAESLELANGVINTITTRSDVFACWFVVHGYSREDCTGLKDTDPMIPSIARRFLMVVDRSNVTGLGQEPRIVLFKEVPLTQ